MSSWSLAKAIAEPAKETVPIKTPSRTSKMTYVAGCVDLMWMNSVIDTSDAAPPPTPLKIATNCGIAVIFTKRAVGTATTAPMNMARRISQTWRRAWPST